jgi:ribosomal protein L3 glutamine methyltransferase
MPSWPGLKLNIEQCINSVAEQLVNSDVFFGHGTDNPVDEAAYLVLEGLDFGFDENLDYGRQLSSEELAKLDEILKQRIELLKPVAYIVGKAWFAGHPFYCDERALIPRSPIAELIANKFTPLLSRVPEKILDLCCGGGSIGIASALEFENAIVMLADISLDALSLAEENIALHQLEQRVHTQQSDLFLALAGEGEGEECEMQRASFDLIVSNPPYVSREEVEALPDEYHHEPELGLVSDDDGLAIPLEILRNAADFLTDDGVLVMEVGFSHELLAQRLKDVPLLWLEFEFGGEGVLALTASQLRQYREAFN